MRFFWISLSLSLLWGCAGEPGLDVAQPDGKRVATRVTMQMQADDILVEAKGDRVNLDDGMENPVIEGNVRVMVMGAASVTCQRLTVRDGGEELECEGNVVAKLGPRGEWTR